MDVIERTLETLASRVQSRGESYVQNGVRFCSKCHTPKEAFIKGLNRIMPVPCSCQMEAQAALDVEQERMRCKLETARLRAEGLSYEEAVGWRFDTAEETPLIRKAKQYVENWNDAYRENLGLIFSGDVGTGKTFAAACIVNALIDRGISVMMTSIPLLLVRLSDEKDKASVLNDLDQRSLLVLDDFGVERKTEYSLEQTFAIIDRRYRIGKPMIVTTNLSPNDLKQTDRMEYKRIYSRLLSMCTAVIAEGEDRRIVLRKEKRRSLAKIFEKQEETKNG